MKQLSTTPLNYKPRPNTATTPLNYKLKPNTATTPLNYKRRPNTAKRPLNYKPRPNMATTPLSYKPRPNTAKRPLNYINQGQRRQHPKTATPRHRDTAREVLNVTLTKMMRSPDSFFLSEQIWEFSQVGYPLLQAQKVPSCGFQNSSFCHCHIFGYAKGHSETVI